MITKDEIAAVLGLQPTQISDEVFAWAVAQFYSLTGYSSTETTKTYKKYCTRTADSLCLPYKGISEILSIKSNGAAQSFTENTDLFVNEDTGFILYTQGFSGKIEIKYTVAAYTHTVLCDTLISLLCAKAIALFTPDMLGFVKRIKIGDYEKEMYSYTNYKDGFIDTLMTEIENVLSQILYGGTGLVKGVIL